MKHEYIYPDCPHCGNEMQRMMRHGERTPEYKIFGQPFYWWQCPECGFASPEKETEADALEAALALTEEATLK